MNTGSALAIGKFSLDWMVVALIAVLAALAWSLYRAQRAYDHRRAPALSR